MNCVCLCFQTIGGHIISADPLSDLNPVLMTIGAKVQLHSESEYEDHCQKE